HWISFSDSLFILGPGETKQLTATFSPPQDSAFSYDYAIEFVRAAPSAINSPTTDHLAGAVSILALLDVNSRDSKHQAAISNFKPTDRKSTRLNSSHVKISYAVFCLKKKKKKKKIKIQKTIYTIYK